jgi:hypothetical protein
MEWRALCRKTEIGPDRRLSGLLLSVSRGIVIVYHAAREPWRSMLIFRIAVWAGHPSAVTFARVGPLGMDLANPSVVFTSDALHWTGL